MSRSALAQRFKELLDDTPMNYLANWRMQAARALLRDSEASLQQIAERVGYQSESAFHRAFKRIYNETPGTYRKAGR